MEFENREISDGNGRTGPLRELVLAHAKTHPVGTASLWNRVEAAEVRKDAQLSREFILAAPRELSSKEQFEAAVEWAQRELVSKGMIAELSLHNPKSGKNPHVHILATMRTIEGGKFSAKKPREWNDKGLLVHWRETWCDAENAALEKAGRPERVDHRSLKDRRIDRAPEPKIGKEAVGMKERGVVEDPERFKAVRRIRILNQVRPMMRAILHRGEVGQIGMGDTWWEKSITFMARIRAEAEAAVKFSWRRWVQRDRKDEPDISR